MFLRTPTLRSGGLKLSYHYLRQWRLYIPQKKTSSQWELVFLRLEINILVKPR